MTSNTPIPRYFVPAAAATDSAEPRAGDPSWIVRVQDLFRLGGPEMTDREWVVGADLDGSLDLVAVEDRGALAGEVQAHLAYHEISIGGRVRRIAAEQLFLFGVQLVEQPADTRGLNPPVYLYGRMSGPFPRPPGADLPVCDGQLTVTRADVLDGLGEGEPHAFRYPSAPGAAAATRSFHLLLPGGRVEEIEKGQAIVLAYPTIDPEVAAFDAANEALTVQILYDLLRGFEEELDRAGKAPLPRRVPVPSRAGYVAQLEADGWRVTGDRAVRMPKSRNLVGAVLGRLFRRETMTLAPEGTTEDFFAVARLALQSLAGWPDARSRALRARSGTAGVAPPRAAPLPTAAVTPPAPVRPLPPRAQHPRRDDWMKDFIEAHSRPGKAVPRITSSRATPAADADWRSDFAAAPVEAPDQGRGGSPEWMKDFEGVPRPQRNGRKR